MDRLIEYDTDADLAWIKGHASDSCMDMCEEVSGECWRCDIMACMEKLCAYEDAEEQGRLIELPFAVGSSFYEIYHSPDGWTNITEWKVDGYSYCNNQLYIHTEEPDIMFSCNHIGLTLFATQEEAEAKLAETEAKKDGQTDNTERH